MNSPHSDPSKTQAFTAAFFWRAAKSYSMMVLLSAFFCGFIHGNLDQIFRMPEDPYRLATLQILVICVLVLVGLHFLFQELFPSYAQHRIFLRKLLGESRWIDVLSLTVLASLGEELLFRGVLQPYVGLSITSLVVCILHISPYGLLTAWSGYAFCFAFLQGILFAYSHSLFPSWLLGILIHLHLNLQVNHDSSPS
jgi:membrane protease YdiL (CAAX protease family)